MQKSVKCKLRCGQALRKPKSTRCTAMATSANAARTRLVPMLHVLRSRNNNLHDAFGDDPESPPEKTNPSRAGDDRGMTTSRISLSPDAVAVNRSKEDGDRRREDPGGARRDRDRSHTRDHRHPAAVELSTESTSSRRRDRSEDRNKDRSRHSHSSSRRRREHSRDRTRDKERDRDRDRDYRRDREPYRVSQDSRHRDRSREKKDGRSHTDRQHRPASRSPSSRKRQRSRSRSRGDSESRKSRRTRSPRRSEDLPLKPEHISDSQPFRSHRDHRSPPPRETRSPERRDRHSRRRHPGVERLLRILQSGPTLGVVASRRHQIILLNLHRGVQVQDPGTAERRFRLISHLGEAALQTLNHATLPVLGVETTQKPRDAKARALQTRRANSIRRQVPTASR